MWRTGPVKKRKWLEYARSEAVFRRAPGSAPRAFDERILADAANEGW
jgi:hypothetical protein